jgi:xylulose-5-phosphate/fructose-6-phosphate phosphoketolase
VSGQAESPPVAHRTLPAVLPPWVGDESVEALWRALNYLCAAQLYLRSNVTLARPLAAQDVKEQPGGHWGVCPPVNLVLAGLAPMWRAKPRPDLWVIHGAGHAGPSAFAFSYLTGALGERWPAFRRTAAGLDRVVAEFPHTDSLGSEITAMVPGHRYMGGQLGPALAFATGCVLDAPQRLAVALIGDGECETGAATAAWLGGRALIGSGTHGRVLPVVLLNGLRMGSRSLLAGLTGDELDGHFRGLGYLPFVTDGSRIGEFRHTLRAAIDALPPVGSDGRPTVLVVRLAKGATGPVAVAGRRILGTPAVHKAPLRDPRNDPAELAVLAEWLASYRPAELLTPGGHPTPLVDAALPPTATTVTPYRVGERESGTSTARPAAAAVTRGTAAAGTPPAGFGSAVAEVVRARAAYGSFRLFSPDELRSNRIDLETEGSYPGWVTEVLNEELCHMWLQGYLESGRAGLFVSYEAFATVNTSLLSQYLKHRAVARGCGDPPVPSLNYLLTSLGWNNVYSHQNPGLISSLVETGDPSVRIYTPADPARVASVLAAALASTGRMNVIVAGKHPQPPVPAGPVAEEHRTGAAIWPDRSDDVDEPDLVLAAAGDVAARHMSEGLALLRDRYPTARFRFVHVAELTALGDPELRPHAISPAHFSRLFGSRAPVLLAVPGYAGVLGSLLWSRPRAQQRFTVLGYREPGRPLSPAQLLRFCGLDAESICHRGSRLLRTGQVGTG